MKSSVSFNSELSKFGIGLFETIKIENDPLDLDLHMDRLFNSIKELNFNIKYSKEDLKKEVIKYINDNNIKNKALRLTVFDEGYNISIRDVAYSKETYEKGFKLIISPIKRGNSILYKHKTTNYYENIYTKRYASSKGYDDGLFVDCDGNILECSMSNIFFIKDNTIYTPNKELPLLNGIMKKRILDICEELNIELIEKNIRIKDIEEYDFAFITNSLMKAIKVTQIEQKVYNSSNELFDKIVVCI
ncbi:MULTISPECIES: aminotransferase class IV [unclassified Romboutsia]|uniref:aminotransferase class IV n=1 Tax=unclassified Romboutsia TaxID=2626894 RepID=UPI0008234DA4|nr:MULTISPECIES: aminotransferase class IV [unclassified Romboutsia]SCG96697.1 Branched-chain-amino-acid aminotransferase [uncultured Clostridium sp.]